MRPRIFITSSSFVLWEAVSQTKYCSSPYAEHFLGTLKYGPAAPLPAPPAQVHSLNFQNNLLLSSPFTLGEFKTLLALFAVKSLKVESQWQNKLTAPTLWRDAGNVSVLTCSDHGCVCRRRCYASSHKSSAWFCLSQSQPAILGDQHRGVYRTRLIVGSV